MPVFPYNADFSFFSVFSPPSLSENITVFYLHVFNSVAKKILGYKNIGGALAPTLAPPLPLHLRGLLEKYPTFGREKETGLLGALDT